MKIFVDANVLVSVIKREYPLYNYSSRILSIANKPPYLLYTSPLNLAITFYFAQKNSKNNLAKKKIDILQQHFTITEMNNAMVKSSLQNKKVEDFEDGLQYYSALNSGCECILTEDIDDYYFSDIEVINCQDFIMKYLL